MGTWAAVVFVADKKSSTGDNFGIQDLRNKTSCFRSETLGFNAKSKSTELTDHGSFSTQSWRFLQLSCYYPAISLKYGNNGINIGCLGENPGLRCTYRKAPTTVPDFPAP